MPGLAYRFVRFASDAALGLFFSDIEFVGKENLPKKGPVILVGNHNNQFVDSMVVLRGVRRQVSFIIAEVSMHKPIIGQLAKMLAAVPVVRPQDKAVKASGVILTGDVESLILVGQGTKFTQDLAQKGCTISIKGAPNMVVDEVLSDSEVRIKRPLDGEVDFKFLSEIGAGKGCEFKVIPKLDQHEVFDKVHEMLHSGGLISIFPEGGSHDRTDLLPLKAGVSIMALGAAAKFDTPVQVIPYGINYMAGHLFRSKVFVEIGKPLEPTKEQIQEYKQGSKRDACNELLAQINESLHSVVLNAPNYATLKMLRTARRMYQGSIKLSPHEYLELSRRFTEGYEIWKEDPRFMDLLHEIAFYLQEAHSHGLTDKQVRDLPPFGTCHTWWRAFVQMCISVFVVLILFPLALPGVLINYPLVWRVQSVVTREMAKAVAGSKVKIAGRDVAATQTILTTAKTIPQLYTLYAIIAFVVMWFTWNIAGDDTTWYGWALNNMVWILPLFIWVSLPFYSWYSLLVMEKAAKRANLIPLLWVQLTTVRKGKSTAPLLRTRRKAIVLRVQSLVEEFIEENPEWAANRVISREQLLAQRRTSDLELSVKLEEHNKRVMESHKPKVLQKRVSHSLLSMYDV